MKTLFRIINRTINDTATDPVPATECNYADNYYGDQICTLKRET